MTNETKPKICNKPFIELGKLAAELWNLETFGSIGDSPIYGFEEKVHGRLTECFAQLIEYCDAYGINVFELLWKSQIGPGSGELSLDDDQCIEEQMHQELESGNRE